MGKTKNKSRSELEFLRGQVRQLKSELKYYKRRSHIENSIIDDVIADGNVSDLSTDVCPECKGCLIHYDFHYAILSKCSDCEYEKRQKKK